MKSIRRSETPFSTRVFSPGQRLNVEDLAGNLGVSFTPVRQALQLLAAEGLIVIQPRSGTYVATLSPRDVEETFDIRRALECLAAETAVVNATDEDSAWPRNSRKARGSDRIRRGSLEACGSEYRIAPHDIRLSGNRRVAEIYDGLHAHLTIARLHRAASSWQSRLDRSMPSMSRLLKRYVIVMPRRFRVRSANT